MDKIFEGAFTEIFENYLEKQNENIDKINLNHILSQKVFKKQAFEHVHIPNATPKLVFPFQKVKNDIVLKKDIDIIGLTPKVSSFVLIRQFFLNNILAISLSLGFLFTCTLLFLYFKGVRELVANSEFEVDFQDEKKISTEKFVSETFDEDILNVINFVNTTKEIPIEQMSKEFTLKNDNKSSPTVNKLVEIFIKKCEDIFSKESKNIDLENLIKIINEFRYASHDELRNLWGTEINTKYEVLKVVGILTNISATPEQKNVAEIYGRILKDKIALTDEEYNLIYKNILVIEAAKKNLLKQYQKEKREKK